MNWRRAPLLLATLAALMLAACGGDTNYQGGDSDNTNNSQNNGDANNGGTNNGANNGDVNNGTNNGDSNNTNNGDVNNANNGDVNNANNGGNNNANNGGNNGGNNGNNGNNGNVPDTPTIGGDCLGNEDCTRGEFCVGASPLAGVPGYCTVINCDTSADCAFPRGGTFCCSNFGQTRGCFREADGAVCGDEQGQQNDSCAMGGQSDCDGAEDVYCAQFYDRDTAVCAQACNPADPESCPEDTWCFETQRNFGICLPHGDTPDRESCREDPWSCGEEGYCAQQVVDDPYRYCSSLCRGDADCGEQEWCQIYPAQQQGTCQYIGDLGEGESCTEDRFGCGEGLFCLNEGTRFARCTSLCGRDSDCDQDAGFFCQIYDPANGRGLCALRGERGNGELCGDDPFSCQEGSFCLGGYQNNYNAEAYCAAECTEDPGACGEGFYCQPFGEQSFCQPDGESQPYEPCQTALDCARETYCVSPGAGEMRYCSPQCYQDGDCGEQEYCTSVNADPGVCLPTGDVAVGEPCDGREDQCQAGAFCAGPDPVCISDCTEDAESCPEGMFCLDANQQGRRYCYPHGDTPAYEGCAGNYDCEPGSYCDRRNGEDAGICLPNCRNDSDCDGDFWCFRTRAWSQCLPRNEGQTGDSCAQDGFGCAEDHLCLYSQTEQAYCAQDCTGFPEVCAQDEVCRYFGNGVNLCFKVGEREVGESCSENPQLCGEEAVCIGVGQPGAFCAQLCTFDSQSCPEDTQCVFSPGGLGFCLPEGWDPEDPVGSGPL